MQGVQLRNIIEAALLAAGQTLDVSALEKLFDETERPDRDVLQAALEDIEADCKGRGFELKRTASGYRLQIREEFAPWINRLWEEKPKKYSRALLETLALIAYRQPLTRGDIEQVRGVAVSSDTIRALQDREWVRSVGHRDVPGRPALYATTKKFLDDFNLASLNDLPPLSEIRDMDVFNEEFGFDNPQPSTSNAPSAVVAEDGETLDETGDLDLGADPEVQAIPGDSELEDDLDDAVSNNDTSTNDDTLMNGNTPARTPAAP
tara:strand:- start:21508 stop:22296 length:789 start_codon:yes stop_codon:yes gene_type:complete